MTFRWAFLITLIAFTSMAFSGCSEKSVYNEAALKNVKTAAVVSISFNRNIHESSLNPLDQLTGDDKKGKTYPKPENSETKFYKEFAAKLLKTLRSYNEITLTDITTFNKSAVYVGTKEIATDNPYPAPPYELVSLTPTNSRTLTKDLDVDAVVTFTFNYLPFVTQSLGTKKKYKYRGIMKIFNQDGLLIAKLTTDSTYFLFNKSFLESPKPLDQYKTLTRMGNSYIKNLKKDLNIAQSVKF